MDAIQSASGTRVFDGGRAGKRSRQTFGPLVAWTLIRQGIPLHTDCTGQAAQQLPRDSRNMLAGGLMRRLLVTTSSFARHPDGFAGKRVRPR